MWGSQIEALLHLNGSRPHGVSEVTLKAQVFDESGASKIGDDFVRWLGFVESRHLIRREDGMLYISDAGVYLLNYLISEGISLSKNPM